MEGRENELSFQVGRLITAVLVIGAALLAVSCQGQPANDSFANRSHLTGTNIIISGSNVGATREPNEPNIAGNAGGKSVWWSWTAPSDGSVTISTARSSFDTLAGVYCGSSLAGLTEVASNNDEDSAAAIYTSKLTFDAVAGQAYQIAVDGEGGASGSLVLQLQLSPPATPRFAPAWSLPAPDGTQIHSTNFAGKIVLVNFWDTSCVPCKEEMPDFVALLQKYRADGLVVVGVSLDETAEPVKKFLTAAPVNYPIVMANTATQQAFGDTSALPVTFLIDRQNIVRNRFVGRQSRSMIERAIVSLLSNTKQTR